MLVDYAEGLGGKASGLARLRRLGFRVPEGRVVPAEFLVPLIGADEEEVGRSPVFERIAAYAESFWRRGEKIILRSSGAAEDSAKASFAGQFESSRDIGTPSQLTRGLHHVLSGAAHRRLGLYRGRLGLDEGERAFHLIVQQFVAADFSGVAFGCHPIHGDADVAVISAVRGFGGDLLGGSVSGDVLVVDKRSGRVVTAPPGGALPGLRGHLQQLVAVLVRLEEADTEAFPDLEFAIAEGDLCCLQWRPVTTVRRIPPSRALSAYYGRELLGEWLPDQVSPMFETLLLPRLLTTFARHLRTQLGYRLRPPLHLVVDGFFYYRLPLHPSFFLALFRLPSFVSRGDAYWRSTVEAAIERIDTFELDPLQRDAWSLVAEVEELAELSSEIVAASLATIPVAVGVELLLRVLYFLTVRVDSPLDYLETVAGYSSMSGRAEQHLVQVGRALLDVPEEERQRLLGGDGRPALTAELRRLPAVRRFLDLYGHLSSRYDLNSRTLRESGFWLRTAVELARAGKEGAAEAGPSVFPQPVQRPLRLPWRPLAPIVRRLLQRLATTVSTYLGIRDDRAFYSQYGWDRIRSRLIVLGLHLQQRGGLDTAEEVFALPWSGLKQCVLGTSEPPEPVRRGDSPTVPQLSINAPWWIRWYKRRTLYRNQDTGGQRLTGQSGSPGRAIGNVLIADELDDLGRLRQGDVLVCSMTTPAWTAAFGLVSAVVTEIGNPLSHAAVVAREYGIPCVVGATSARARLRDITRVLVDGNRGIVEPKDGPSSPAQDR